jgi:exodeoxyribonuclease VII small subunit
MNDTPADVAAKDITSLSFEEALEQLGGIVRQLEAGQVPLDSAITLYERATLLKAHCDARLKDAEARIEKIRIGSDGSVTGTVPFDA